jgi:beta-galactosidase
VSINDGWLFGGTFQPGMEAVDFPTAGWAGVCVPHCVATLSWWQWNPSAWEQLWIYQRTLQLPGDLSGIRVFLDFEGVMSSASPYLNGQPLTRHLGGYLPFSYELTGRVQPGANVLSVVVDGTWQDVPPGGGPGGAASIDYLQPAGIYRDVWLRLVPQSYLYNVTLQPEAPPVGDCSLGVAVTIDTSVAISRWLPARPASEQPRRGGWRSAAP